MTFVAMKRLAKWLYQKSWWNEREDLDAMRRDFMREVVSNSTFSTDEKVALIAALAYGPEEEEKKNDE